MSDTRRLTEITEALEDAQTTLDLIVERFELGPQVRAAIGARREQSERSRIEIERSLGQHAPDGDGRR